ncbi:NAD(P)-binding protein [Streptomyces sp. NPDC020731]|uniref:NAD(P)-binding protein n=1 Tax=Streptomyces sp. NPDC020731 TaxID=3365085 RepID=UPI003790840A
MEHVDVAVIGGGRSGLTTAHALLRRGLRPVVLEASCRTSGSWPRHYDSLTLLSPARCSSLPGVAFPGADRDRHPHRDEAVACLTASAAHLDAEIRAGSRVATVRRGGAGGRCPARGAGRDRGVRHLRAAPPPLLPGLETFTGTLLHAAGYRDPQLFTGQRVVVVGAGNSAVRIAAELAKTAWVTLAGRAPVKSARQKIAGRDLRFRLQRTGLDIAPLGGPLRKPPTRFVIDDGRHRAKLDHGAPHRRPVFTGVEEAKATWVDGGREGVDAIAPATAPTCPASPLSTDPRTPPETPGAGKVSPPRCRGRRSSGWSGSAACRRTRCAAQAGTRIVSPAAWPPVSHAGDGPRRIGSTCVNIDACRM